MPRISMFFGIVVYMYYDDHHPPHFHALYEGSEAMFDFEGNIMKGFLPRGALQLIKEWVKFHEEELKENWERARKFMPLNWIEPLR
jgi:hypothetical protein